MGRPLWTPSLEALDESSGFSLEEVELARRARASGITTLVYSETSCFANGLVNIKRGIVALVGGRVRLLSQRVVTKIRKGVQAREIAAFVIDAWVLSEWLRWTGPSLVQW
jgi:hypothetical protein